MESSEASWHSFDPSVAVEDSEAMAQLLGVQYFGNEHKQPAPTMAMYWPGCQEADDQYYGSAAPYYMHQPSSGAGCYDDGHAGYYGSGTVTMTGDFFVPDEQVADPSFMLDLNLDFEDQDGGGGADVLAACKRKLLEDHKDESATCTVPKKKSRSTAMPAQVKKGKSAQSKKAQAKGACSRGNREESNGGDGNNVQCSGNYLSDDDSLEMTACSNVSSASRKSSSGGAKARAGRGAATDPQSLYARKRRERINERLKILQNLVPNGTKVDISTMLEEAVQYVKFMQLQIKLLSSDDTWMFAPIAYNGVNVGLDLKISPPQQ